MTTYDLGYICGQLQTELRKLIVKISPSERGSERFRPHDPEIQGEIEEKSGLPRTFWVRPVGVGPTNMGASARRYEVTWELKIGYPVNGWDVAAISDVDDVRAAVNISGGLSTVAGVGYRVVPPKDSIPTFERTANWMWVTIPIVSMLETTTAAKVLPNYQVKTVNAVTVATSPVTLYSFAATRDGSIEWHYHVVSADAKTSRGGLLQAAWDYSAGTAEYNDESTEDLVEAGAAVANTDPLSFAVSVAAGVVSLTASSSSGNWTVRTTELSRSDET